MKRYVAVLITLIFATLSFAQHPAPIPLGTGQLIAFLGDSITQQNCYTRYVELLLNSRYPDAKLRFVNAGWSGRHAGHLLDSDVLQRDLLRLKPNLVLVMFGMNDGWYKNPPMPAAMDAYKANLAALTMKISAALPAARIVLLTPTISDTVEHAYLKGYNDTLATMAAYVRDFGKVRGYRVIDLFTPMLEADTTARAADPQFTMLLDGVHPTPVGHWLIATLIAREFGVSPTLVHVTINDATAKVTEQTGARVRFLLRVGDALFFTTEFPRIPVALPLEARGALLFAQVQGSRDQALVTITGLTPTRLYGIYANEQLVGRFTGAELAGGVDWLTAQHENPLTARVLQLAMEKFHYHWTSWRAPDTGLAETAPDDFYQKDWDALEESLARMTRRADLREAESLAEAKTVEWRIFAETSVPLVKWETLGPFNYQSFATAYPPEVNGAGTPTWTPLTADAHGFVDLMPMYGAYRNSVVSARTRIFVPRQARLSLSVGSDGPVKVWLNGRLCLARDIQRAAEPEQDTCLATLRTGWNTLLLRETRGQSWGFYAQAYVSGLSPVEMLDVKSGTE